MAAAHQGATSPSVATEAGPLPSSPSPSSSSSPSAGGRPPTKFSRSKNFTLSSSSLPPSSPTSRTAHLPVSAFHCSSTQTARSKCGAVAKPEMCASAPDRSGSRPNQDPGGRERRLSMSAVSSRTSASSRFSHTASRNASNPEVPASKPNSAKRGRQASDITTWTSRRNADCRARGPGMLLRSTLSTRRRRARSTSTEGSAHKTKRRESTRRTRGRGNEGLDRTECVAHSASSRRPTPAQPLADDAPVSGPTANAAFGASPTAPAVDTADGVAAAAGASAASAAASLASDALLPLPSPPPPAPR
mmetsp:Transcript_153671/g.491369  ORF Transcript_153671/g.491369 Transcript_153671/m.491369 type:complete len:304 (-) Transcript_153671:1021-1932(-)